jgi:hypothetical protein
MGPFDASPGNGCLSMLWDGYLTKCRQYTLHMLDAAEVSHNNQEVGGGVVVGALGCYVGGQQSILVFFAPCFSC